MPGANWQNRVVLDVRSLLAIGEADRFFTALSRPRFRIRPKTVWPADRSEGSRQGYTRDQFEAVRSKYLEPEQAALAAE